MKTRLGITFIASLLLICAGLVSACSSSSPDRRIKTNQQLFDSLTPEAQASVRAGRVEVGFTSDMVLLALGKPDRYYMRTTQAGSSEVWAYTNSSSSPSISFGLGMGLGGRGPGMSTGIGIATTAGSGDRADDRTRVIFDNGKVASIESATSR